MRGECIKFISLSFSLVNKPNILLMKLNKIHHVAVICSDYEQSKLFGLEDRELTLS